MADFNLDISDSSIEALSFKKSLLGKGGVAGFGRVELEEGVVKNGQVLDEQKLASKVGELVKKGKINFTLPDLRVFMNRVQLPLDISRSVLEPFLKEKVAEFIPYDIEDLAFDFKVVNETEKGREILFTAIAKKILAGYLRTFKIAKLTPLIAVPESVAAFEIFRETVVKDELVLYVDVGGRTSTLSFFDKFGPLLTINEPAETKLLKEEIKKATSFLKEKHDREVKRVVLGGGGSLEMDAEVFSKEAEIWTTKIDKILEDKLTKLSLRFSVGDLPPVLFVNVFGLALLGQSKEGLNLLKQADALLARAKEEEAREKAVEGKKEGEERVEGEGKEKEGREQTEEASKDAGGRLTQEEQVPKSQSKSPKVKIVIVGAVIAFLTFLALFIFLKRPSTPKKEKEISLPAPTVEVTVAPQSLTPAKGIDRKDVKVKILNGSGIAGKAGEAATLLENLGYQIVETGNANSFDYEETVIQIKKEKKDFFPDLTNDLKSAYTVSREEIELSEEEEVDAVVIVGKK